MTKVKKDSKAYRRSLSWFKTSRTRLIVIGALVAVGVCIALVSIFLVPSGPADGADKPTQNDVVSGSIQTNPLAGKALYVNPDSNAARQAAAWRSSRPEDAKLMDKMAALPSSEWIDEHATAEEIRNYVQAAERAGRWPVLVAYNIVNRDCGKYSAGGADDIASYQAYIARMAEAIGQSPAVVILEPDALVQIDLVRANGQPCLSETEKQAYYDLTRHSVETLKSKPHTVVYIDAGNSGWMPDAVAMSAKLERAGVRQADGFSLNVANFRATAETMAYGNEIAYKIGDKHYVIDTSRNGLGHYDNPRQPEYNWCNPPGRALGHYPTVDTGKELVDAYLYIKNIGESDGADPDRQRCFGGLKAGSWMPEYALGLAKRWPAELQP